MSEQISDRVSSLPLLPAATAARAIHALQQRRGLPAWAAAGSAAVLIGLYFWLYEGDGGLADAVFALAVTLCIGAAIVCVSRRVVVAAVLVTAMVGIIRTISYSKQQATEVLLHSYDLITFASSWSAVADTWSRHRSLMLGVAVALLVTASASWIAARCDTTRVSRLHAAGVLAILAGIAWTADTLRGPRRHTEFYFENIYVTFFYASWSETVGALWRGRLIETAAPRAPQQDRFELPTDCTSMTKPPHIILIHQESVVPPALFPTLSYDRSLDSFFHSFGGRLNKLRVETFGGASWLTEFSLLTGLPAQAFGGMRQFLPHLMAGGIHDTLPQALGRCGYRNVMFYPMLRRFLGSGRFFEAAGIGEIFDAKAQRAKLPNERDRFYYTNALTEIGRHIKASPQPLFVYIQTMAAHGPYDYAYNPEVAVPGGGPGTSAEVSEYLRRLAMARMDYAFLRHQLVRRFPGQRFLIVHYGDHQPTAAAALLGFDENASIEDILASGNERARITYYALDGVRYRPPPLPSLDVLDIAYLGTLLMEAAGLPLSESHRERRRLMLLCEGRYHDCPAREAVLRFHRRLIDSGLMKAL